MVTLNLLMMIIAAVHMYTNESIGDKVSLGHELNLYGIHTGPGTNLEHESQKVQKAWISRTDLPLLFFWTLKLQELSIQAVCSPPDLSEA